MEKAHEQFLDPGGAVAIGMAPGMRLRVTDMVGRQIGLLAAFDSEDIGRQLSMPRSIVRAAEGRGVEPRRSEGLMVGDLLLADDETALMRVTADTMAVQGLTGFHMGVCNRPVKQAVGEAAADWCTEAICIAAEPWGVPAPDPDEKEALCLDAGAALDLFAKPFVDPDYMQAVQNNPDLRDRIGDPSEWQVLGESASAPGDYLEFEALIECAVSCCNCADGDEAGMKIELFV